MEYINSPRTDPCWNLALEQYVFDSLDRSKSYFMLWQNHNTIVVGKNQNTVAEINSDFVRAHDITVVRRLSGGGAVYHDLGNLNFTFITDADKMDGIDLHMFCVPIVETLRSFGVQAEISGRNDITVDGKKFSGNSQYVREGRVMHHGTIMFDSDLTTVTQALQVDRDKIQSKGIKSVASRVTNLRPYMPEGTTLAQFRQRLLEYLSVAEPLHTLTLTAAAPATPPGSGTTAAPPPTPTAAAAVSRAAARWRYPFPWHRASWRTSSSSATSSAAATPPGSPSCCWAAPTAGRTFCTGWRPWTWKPTSTT